MVFSCEASLAGARSRPVTVYTIGHSNRRLGELVGLLKRYGVRLVVDVRRRPGSRCCPWFSRRVLERELPRRGIAYYWLGDLLGGLDVDYPRYVYTMEYRKGIGVLVGLALACEPAAIMCREKLWTHCHRAFIADTLHVMGFRVIHIIDLGLREKHVPVGLAPNWAYRVRVETL